MTCWPIRFDCQVWATPITPVTIGIATIPATSSVSVRVFRLLPCESTLSSRSRSRNGEIMLIPAEITIMPSRPDSRIR